MEELNIDHAFFKIYHQPIPLKKPPPYEKNPPLVIYPFEIEIFARRRRKIFWAFFRLIFWKSEGENPPLVIDPFSTRGGVSWI